MDTDTIGLFIALGVGTISFLYLVIGFMIRLDKLERKNRENDDN